MSAFGRLLRFSAVSLAAAGGVSKISKEISNRTRECTPNSDLELVLVQIAFRHGARTPIFRPPCEELEQVTWPADLLMGTLPHTAVDYELKHVSGGPAPSSEIKDRMLKKLLKGGSPVGQLTKVGQQQMYELGKKRGRTYVDDLKFLQEAYNPQEIYVRTSNFQRTIDSARCVVAGMFGKEQSKGLTMYAEDEEKEFLYPNLSYCENLKTWWKYSQSFEGVKFIEGFHDRQKRICEALKLNYMYDRKSTLAIHLRDIVAAMMVHNMEVPKAVLQNLNAIEEQALQLFLSIQCGLSQKKYWLRKEVLSLSIGMFLEHIVDNFAKKIDDKHNYKMMLYSVHDTTVAPLLLALGVFDNRWPDFAADLAFELYRDESHVYYVRVLYKGKEKIIPGCSSPFCPLNKFKELVSEYFVDNWERECKVELKN